MNIWNACRDELQKIAESAVPKEVLEDLPKERGLRPARRAFMAELGPAAGATIGAMGAGYLGINPLAGAAAGYGIGAIPEIYHGVKNWSKYRHMIPKVR